MEVRRDENTTSKIRRRSSRYIKRIGKHSQNLMLAWRLLVWLLSNFVMRGRVLLLHQHQQWSRKSFFLSLLLHWLPLLLSLPRSFVVSFICDQTRSQVRQGDGNPSSLFVDEKLRSPRQVNNKSHVLSSLPNVRRSPSFQSSAKIRSRIT